MSRPGSEIMDERGDQNGAPLSSQARSTASMDRRRFLKTLAAGVGAAAVVGFDPTKRTWVTSAQAAEGDGGFEGVPELDGELRFDYETRDAASKDKGNIIRTFPAAVLFPGSVEDIAKMVRFCARRDIKVAGRGMGHTMFGQCLSPGLSISMTALDQIHSIGPEGADVDAGVLWSDLTRAAFEQGLRPPVLTGFIGLSIAGTLSVGGLSRSNRQGLQIDRVQELTVVTGAGDIHTCSAAQERELFEAVLGGLGQFGVIVRAKVDLVPAHPMARQYLIHYADLATYFSDLRILLERGEFDDNYTLWLPLGSTLVPELRATIFFDPADPPPSSAHLLRGLSLQGQAGVIQDVSYLDYALEVDTQVSALEPTMNWSRLVKPWFDVWIPDGEVEKYVEEALATVKPFEAGPTGFVLLFPQLRSKMGRELYPIPPPEAGRWLWLFDILPASATTDPGPDYIPDWLARNRRLYERALEVGGTRYSIGAIEFTQEDWRRQYGDKWREFARRKRVYDPANIMGPGLGMF